MANPEHVEKLKEGVGAWNQWRTQNPNVEPDLQQEYRAEHMTLKDSLQLIGMNLEGVDLSRANLKGTYLGSSNLNSANLSKANLSGANLIWAHLIAANLSDACLSPAFLSSAYLMDANLRDADLRNAHLGAANLTGANLRNAKLNAADLTEANLSKADLGGADLSGADLSRATLVETNLEGANLTSSSVYGISVWDVKLGGAVQSNLIITPREESVIQVDNLEVAQFVYLLLNNEKIRDVIDTITSKTVLILGRFTPERKVVLDAIREALRKRDYLPILFDFEKPTSRSVTETVSTLAHMARFVIADITEAKSIPQELMRIVPSLPTVPVQPLLLASQHEYGMFDDFRLYPWVLEPTLYADQDTLLADLNEKVIAPAETKAKEQSWKLALLRGSG